MTDVLTGAQLEVLDPTADKYGEGSFPLSRRPDSLDGKRVGLLWNGKPNGDVALKCLGKIIEERHPSATVNFYMGALPTSPTLLNQVAEENDVVIGATADCGSCTTWITHDCIALERKGLPSVIVASAGFEEDLTASAKAFAMPNLQFVVVPLVYNNISVEESEEQTLPVYDDVVSLLTGGVDRSPRPILDEGRGESEVFGDASAIASFTAFNQAFLNRDWSDGYPVLPPTTDAVARLVDGVDGSPDDVVCLLPPGNGEATVKKVAVNAAMAGCEPGDMPVLMAILRGLANKENAQLFRVALMSTSSHAPLVIVNGPVAQQQGINGGRCCLGPGRQNAVNIRIGRATVLCLKNIGRWYPGVMDLDSIGSPRKNIQVLAENEAETPWDPYHVDEGFDATDSTVTVTFSTGEWDIAMQGHLDPIQLAKSIGSFSGGNSSIGYMSTLFGDQDLKIGRLLLLAPPHARPLAEGGFSKKSLANFLFHLGHEPVERIIEPLRKLYVDGKVRKEYEYLFEMSDDAVRQMTMPVIERADLYKIVVAGSVRAKDLLIPLRTPTVTERITRTPNGIVA